MGQFRSGLHDFRCSDQRPVLNLANRPPRGLLVVSEKCLFCNSAETFRPNGLGGQIFTLFPGMIKATRRGHKMPFRTCFLRGTQVWTPCGESRVEDLRVNDLVVTSSGEAKPIQWVWRRRFERQFGQKWGEQIAPIRVARSALGPNTPHRDLYLSRYHCLYLDGVLIPAVDLINNSSIARVDDRRPE